MRLRLSVHRHKLPITHIIWSIPDTSSAQAYTIARLLEDVNQVLPLESGQWGLEDYIVEVDAFECLHFSPVSQTLKADDHVSIRPLLTAEVRARTLCGRYQISEGGQHLVDGIPFGRPYLRQLNRPAVRIPSRKRRRLDDDTVAGDEIEEVAGLITANGEIPVQLRESHPAHSVLHIGQDRQSPSRKEGRAVHFAETFGNELDDSEDDEDFAPAEDDMSLDGSVTTSDASGDGDESGILIEDDKASDGSDTTSDTTSTASDSTGSSDDSESESESDSADSTSDSSSDSDVDSTEDPRINEASNASESKRVISKPNVVIDYEHPITTPTMPNVVPGRGSNNTKRRNLRRKQSEQLKRLKEAGTLHMDATLEDLRAYLNAIPSEDMSEPDNSTPIPGIAAPAGQQNLLDGPTHEIDLESAELSRRKTELMARLGDILDENPAPKVTRIEPTSEPALPEKRHIDPMNASPRPSKRLRPDTAAIGRILARQTRTVEKKSSKAKSAVMEQSPEPDGTDDPEFWKLRINLSAFECWDEEHELSAPPFPFKQHWDPASKLMRESADKKKRKRNRKSESEHIAVIVDKNEDHIFLEYDESPETMKQESDPIAATKSQDKQDTHAAAKPDLPPLPDDVDSLQALEHADVKVGAIIAFKFWVIDPKTVTPQFSNYKTAIVEKEGDSGGGAGTFRLRLAERDVPKSDEEDDQDDMEQKNKVISLMEDEEERDNGIWEGTFTELIAPKLLKRAD